MAGRGYVWRECARQSVTVAKSKALIVKVSRAFAPQIYLIESEFLCDNNVALDLMLHEMWIRGLKRS